MQRTHWILRKDWIMIVAENAKFFTTKEACKRLDITDATLASWVREFGIQKYAGQRRSVIYREEDIEMLYRAKVAPRPLDDGK